jgi:hypothetical protein
VAVDADNFGDLYIAYSYNVIRLVTTTGLIHTVAGNGNPGSSAMEAPRETPLSIICNGPPSSNSPTSRVLRKANWIRP